mmetsp:Transcript_22798/g.25377  ORF Transcript_22798/g.25377 Transcript_22798/m.25377 type:complete len:438 (+) Transcript_22798:46-1359(+)
MSIHGDEASMEPIFDPDLNVWEEEEYDRQFVLWEEGETNKPNDRREFAAGSLNQLILRLTNPRLESAEEFITTFLLTYIAFTTAEKLFTKLTERLFVPQTKTTEVPDAVTMKKISTRVLHVLHLWLKLRFEDFRKANLIPQVQALILVLKSQGMFFVANEIQETLDERLREFGKSIPEQPKRRGRATSFGPVQTMMRYSETEIARALTLIEDKIYKAIQPYELLNQAWAKQKLKYRAVNVLKLIKRFNAVSLWISTCVVQSTRHKDRVKILSKVIRIASELDKLNNFNTCLSVISGVNNASVSRLKFTKESLSHKITDEFARLEEKLSAHGSYANYREFVKQLQLPIVPYLGVYLTDLTFIEDGNPDMIGGLINWKKPQLIYRVIREIARFQRGYYTFTVDDNLMRSLSQLIFLDEQELYSKSLVLEPRGCLRKNIK